MIETDKNILVDSCCGGILVLRCGIKLTLYTSYGSSHINSEQGNKRTINYYNTITAIKSTKNTIIYYQYLCVLWLSASHVSIVNDFYICIIDINYFLVLFSTHL